MKKTLHKIVQLLSQPEDYLRPPDKLRKSWVQITKEVYDFLKTEESRNSLPCCGTALPVLHIAGFETEQIWQQIELQNKPLFAAPDNVHDLNKSNLCYQVACLSSYSRLGKLKLPDGNESEKFDSSIDLSDQAETDDESDELREVSDDELKFKNNEKEKSDSEEEEDSDEFDEGVFDDLKKEGEETGDEEEATVDDAGVIISDEDKRHLSVKEKYLKTSSFSKSEVDSQFLNLRESEWVADNDVLGENLENEFADIDFMADSDSKEEKSEEWDVMYSDFFQDASKDEQTLTHQKKVRFKKTEDNKEDNTSEEFSAEQQDEDVMKSEEQDDSSFDVKDSKAYGTDDNTITPLLGLKKEKKSGFEIERERELKLIHTLEEKNLSEKPWHLKGEVLKGERPANSTLEEHLEYDIASRQRPVITEDTTSLIERIITNRIRSATWDDVERKVRDVRDPFEYKKKLLLDQEKSKKSLAEIYEEEYLKQRQANKTEEEEPKEHKEIREAMDNLFDKLDALANYHFIPRKRKAEIKIKSNLPAITIEESTPVTATDATLLAPQEIVATQKGELKGPEERTKTDKKHDRRKKKTHQKLWAKEREMKLKEKLKKVGKDKMPDVKTSTLLIEKAVKAGKIKLLEGNKGDAVKSSHSFFKQLQEDKTSVVKKRKLDDAGNKNKKAKFDRKSTSQLLL